LPASSAGTGGPVHDPTYLLGKAPDGPVATPTYADPVGGRSVVTGRHLLPTVVPAGPAVLDLLPSLRAALNGSGPAILPHAEGERPSSELLPGEPLSEGEDDPDDPTVAVLATSGSTGRPKGALLSASALLASASATHDRLAGPGRWLLALPAHHIAGLQVLFRSLITGAAPQVMDLTRGFDPAAFVDAATATTGVRRYTALVPTQVRRLLDAGPAARAALAGFDAVLVGGAAAPDGLREEAEAAGARLVATYGMSETCGGCVYDGVPLGGVRAEVDDDGRIHLTGPVLARGYRDGGPVGAFRTRGDGTRWFRTDDAGRLDGERLVVLGRLDDLIVTGGLKVSPAVVEAALLSSAEVAEAVVVGVPDGDWGQRVVAVVVPTAGMQAPGLEVVRRLVADRVGAHAAPRQLLILPELPLRGPGKPDRAALVGLALSSGPVPGAGAPDVDGGAER
jgi:O-succinylbenzoic acid--CoA ligase